MRPIPLAIRKRLEKDPFMEKCCSCGSSPVQWHHPIIHSGRQSNAWYAISPLCYSCHQGNSGSPQLKAKILSELLAIKRGITSGEIYTDMPKVDWYQRKRNLELKLKML